MVEIARVVVIPGLDRAALDAGAALDAHAGTPGYVGRVNGPHGTDRRAAAAADAGGGDLGFDLSDVDGAAGAVPGLVVGPHGTAAGNRNRGLEGTGTELSSHGAAEGAGQGQILPVRPSGGQNGGKGVLPHKGRPRRRMEAPGFQQLPQLHQGVVEVPVAEEDHRHGQGVPAHPGVQIGQHQVGQPPRIDGQARHQHIPRLHGGRGRPPGGQREIKFLPRCVQLLGQGPGQRADHGARGARGAEKTGADHAARPIGQFHNHSPCFCSWLQCTTGPTGAQGEKKPHPDQIPGGAALISAGEQGEEPAGPVGFVKNMVVEHLLVSVQGGLGGGGELRLAGRVNPPALMIDIAYRIDNGQLLPQIAQVLLIAGLGEIGRLGQEGGEVVQRELHPLGLGNVVVGPDEEGDHLFLLGGGGIQKVHLAPQNGVVKLGVHLGLVVAEEADHGGLLHLGKIGDQLLQGLVALIDQVEILVHRVELPLVLSGKPDFPGEVGPLAGVAAVVLHGHVEEEEGFALLFGLVAGDEVFIVGPVGEVLPNEVILGIGKIF